MVAGLLARDALDLVVGRVCSVVGCCCVLVLLCLLASGARSERSERRRQGSSPEGRRPRKRASWSQSGQSPARRNRARRPVAGRAAAQTRRPGILQDRKTPGSRNKHAYMPIHEEREGRNRKDFCRETRSVGAARQATVRERGRRRRRRRAEGGPGRRERSERGCCCSSGGMKRADRRETTTGSFGPLPASRAAEVQR